MNRFVVVIFSKCWNIAVKYSTFALNHTVHASDGAGDLCCMSVSIICYLSTITRRIYVGCISRFKASNACVKHISVLPWCRYVTLAFRPWRSHHGCQILLLRSSSDYNRPLLLIDMFSRELWHRYLNEAPGSHSITLKVKRCWPAWGTLGWNREKRAALGFWLTLDYMIGYLEKSIIHKES